LVWFRAPSRRCVVLLWALGIKKEVFAVHHKRHIAKVRTLTLYYTYPRISPPTPNPNTYLHQTHYHYHKVMAHATVGYCFDGNPENGDEGLLIGLNQAFKVAQKAYRGKGGVKVVKGDCLLTDCNVTGTDVGTPGKPKFALRALWEYGLLPSLDALVAPGGQCAGALVIHQEDNAGRLITLPVELIITKP
jgi:hypothetical protein